MFLKAAFPYLEFVPSYLSNIDFFTQFLVDLEMTVPRFLLFFKAIKKMAV